MAETLFAIFRAEERRQGGGEQIAGRDAAQLFEIACWKDGMRQAESVAVLRLLVQNVALGADVADERHDQLFADRVNGRIGDLGEKLPEVIEQRLRTVGEAGQRHIGAHGADWLRASRGHGREEDAQVLFAVAAGALAAQKRLRVRGDGARGLGQRHQLDLLLIKPLAVGLARGKLLFGFGVGDDALLHRVDEEHAAGLQAAFFEDVLRRNFDDAGFRSENDEIVFGDDVAAGAQAVAIECCADDFAIGERYGRRAVPGLHQGGVVLVEGALIFVHVRVAGPCFGNEHGHDMGQGTAGLVEKFDGVIERGRVAAAGHDDRVEIGDLVAMQRAPRRPTGGHSSS